MNKENCALKLVDEIILYYDARSKKLKKYAVVFLLIRTVHSTQSLRTYCLCLEKVEDAGGRLLLKPHYMTSDRRRRNLVFCLTEFYTMNLKCFPLLPLSDKLSCHNHKTALL